MVSPRTVAKCRFLEEFPLSKRSYFLLSSQMETCWSYRRWWGRRHHLTLAPFCQPKPDLQVWDFLWGSGRIWQVQTPGLADRRDMQISMQMIRQITQNFLFLITNSLYPSICEVTSFSLLGIRTVLAWQTVFGRILPLWLFGWVWEGWV